MSPPQGSNLQNGQGKGIDVCLENELRKTWNTSEQWVTEDKSSLDVSPGGGVLGQHRGRQQPGGRRGHLPPRGADDREPPPDSEQVPRSRTKSGRSALLSVLGRSVAPLSYLVPSSLPV